mmetsp:Transcript_162594/g.312197  ORF Transcript_162594/g.312197 Transcript_162594/m.312197 type:complete len:696 (+) Transcript_162594:77-2164(+)
MKFCATCILLLLGAGIGERTTAVHPVASVISLLEKLAAQAEAEGKEEALLYEKYVRQCGLNKDTLTKAIDAENEKIDELSDIIDAKTKTISTLTKQIDGLNDEDLANQGTIGKQTALRSSTNDLYKKTSGELKATILAMKQALAALTGAQTITEPSMVEVGKKVRKALALIQEQGMALPIGDLAKHVDKYDFKSENVIELLKKLQAGFEEELIAVEAGETDSLNAHSLAINNLDAMQVAVSKSRSAKTAANTSATTDLNDAESEKSSTEDDKKADEASLEAVTSACKTKEEEWLKRSQTRTDEITAIKSAIKIMTKVTGVRTTAPANPVPPSPPALLQVVASPKKGNRRSQAVSRVISLLRATAAAQHSKLLEQMANAVSVRMRAPYDEYVFQPVINMIEKMIFQLQEEQKAEDDHKNWCDKELKKTSVMVSDKTDKKTAHTLEKQDQESKVLQLKLDIKAQNEFIASIVSFQAEITAIKKVGTKENKLALEDAEDAQAALSQAIAVLTQFYKSSGMVAKENWESFAQEPVSLPAKPETWDSEYTGVTDPTNPQGILTLLSEVSTKFADMATNTKSQEAADQKAYDEEMAKQDIDKARRTQDVEEKSMELKQRLSEVKELTSQLKHTQAELDKTIEYQTDLQKACVVSDSTYEDRKAARAKEVTALREAEDILNEAFTKFLQISRPTKFLQISRH